MGKAGRPDAMLSIRTGGYGACKVGDQNATFQAGQGGGAVAGTVEDGDAMEVDQTPSLGRGSIPPGILIQPYQPYQPNKRKL